MLRSRVAFIYLVIAVTFILLSYRMIQLAVGEENNIKTDLLLMNRAPASLEMLNEHVLTLEEMMANIENMTFGAVKQAIEKTIKLINQSNIELMAQYDAWAEVQKQIKRDDLNFRFLRNQIEQLQNIEDERVVSIKRLIDKAEQPSVFENLKSTAVTFFLGILSSIFAVMTYRWVKILKNTIKNRGK